MMFILVNGLLSTMALAANDQQVIVDDPYQTEGVSCETIESWRDPRRYRFIGDFNGDGRQDLAISYSVGMFGNAFGHAWVYLARKDGRYKAVGKLPFHPKAIALYTPRAATHPILAVYLRSSSQEGKIVKYEIGADDNLHEIEERQVQLQSEEGQKLYYSLFEGDRRLIVDISNCETGSPTWLPYR